MIRTEGMSIEEWLEKLRWHWAMSYESQQGITKAADELRALRAALTAAELYIEAKEKGYEIADSRRREFYEKLREVKQSGGSYV